MEVEESREPVEAFPPPPVPICFEVGERCESGDEGRADESRLMLGRMSFFCFEAGRISSRSTGTPRETRKRRRMRDFIQFGGWRGGGVTS